MGSFFAYTLYSAIILLALYLGYKLVLASENQTRFNRTVLLCMYMMSLVVWPLSACVKNIGAAESVDASHVIELVAPQAVEGELSTHIYTILLGVYLCGMLVVAFRSIMAHCRVAMIICRGEHRKLGRYDLVLIEDKRVAPFSWMRYIVMSHCDYESAGEIIAAHEMRHLDKKHWIDLLLAEFVTIVEWFNPAAWLMREELRTVHEYQADKGVIEAGYDAKEYQLLLIHKAIGLRVGSLANSLNHSQLKKRIGMMMQSPASKNCRLKAAILLPAALVAIVLTESPVGASVSCGLCDAAFFDEMPVNVESSSGNDPAVFVDGVHMDYTSINSIDPNKIESISIKKNEADNPNGSIHIKMKE